MKEITKEWIQKAENDYIVAIREFNSIPPVFEAVCFHAQQCIEKYMKAILQENNIEFEKIHDLAALLQLCNGIVPELKELRDELIVLTTYAVDTRYPGIAVSEEESNTSVQYLEKVRGIIRGYFGL